MQSEVCHCRSSKKIENNKHARKNKLCIFNTQHQISLYHLVVILKIIYIYIYNLQYDFRQVQVTLS